MKASVGDRIIIKGHHNGDHDRDCEVIEVRGSDGEPPYLVRWGDTGHESLLLPGSDATVQHDEHAGPHHRATLSHPVGGTGRPVVESRITA